MGAHDVYNGKLSRKSDDESTPEETDTENTSYYANGLADALDYLASYATEIDQSMSKDDVQSAARARADLATQWVDAMETARISRAGVEAIVEELSGRNHSFSSSSSRSGNYDAMRKYILYLTRNINQIYQASVARPW